LSFLPAIDCASLSFVQLFADSAFGHLGSFFSDLSVRLCQHDHAEEMDAPALAFLGAIFGAFSFPCHARCDGGLFFWLVNVRKRRTVLLFEFKWIAKQQNSNFTPHLALALAGWNRSGTFLLFWVLVYPV
jgi:hypothetical protein